MATLEGASFSFLSGVTDFEIFTDNGQVTLYALGVAQNGVSVFSLSGGQTAAFLEETSLSAPVSMAPLDMSVIALAGASALCLEPWTAGGVTTYALDAQGQMGAASQIGGAAALGAGMVQTVMVDAGGGDTWVFGGLFGGGGLARLTLDANGALSGSEIIAGTAAEDVTALVQASLGAGDFLFSARLSGAAVTSWQIGSAGQLVEVASLGVTEGVGIAVPTALEFVDFAGESYLVLASAGSSSITVMAVSASGGLSLRDHVIDSLDTRFANPEVLSVVPHQGRVYVLSGGSDDGINLFELLPGGRLVHLESMADTNAMTLSNVSAITAVSVGGEIQIFVAGGSETGLTQLSFIPDATGVVLTGLSGNATGTGAADILAAGGGGVWLDGAGGADILMDGTGSDTLTGGTGADLFVLSPDLMSDTILDFQPGIDRIDLGAYPMLRNVDQVQITPTANGAILTYQGESLTIITQGGTALSAADFSTLDLLPLTHAMPLSGAAYDAQMTGGAGDDVLIGNGLGNVMAGGGGDDILRGKGGGDTLNGGAGVDTVSYIGAAAGVGARLDGGVNWGGAAGDTITGVENLSGTNFGDVLVGNSGANTLEGNGGNDTFYGKGGGDTLNGGAGVDILHGQAGNDVLNGGADADTFVFNAGADVIEDFADNTDTIRLDDALWGGAGLTTAQILAMASVSGGDTVFDFGGGNTLTLQNFTDIAALADDILVF